MNIIEMISADLKIDYSYLSRIAERSSFYYKDYKIPKKNGDKRPVSQPSPELKTLQYWVVRNIFEKIPVSKAAYAYKKGDSIKRHAELHCKSRFIFHADICNFFPSIHSKHLSEILKSNNDIFDSLGLDINNSIQDINKICFRKDSLCIGAVSSPIISNIIMYSFDDALIEYCKENNYIYSRYADDIYISSRSYINNDVIDILCNELHKYGFTLNRSKTRFYSQKYRRKITGLILTNDSQASIGTERRIEIKKMIYNKLVNGIGDSEKIMGYLAFLKDIEPNTYNNLIIKYSCYCDGDIINELRK